VKSAAHKGSWFGINRFDWQKPTEVTLIFGIATNLAGSCGYSNNGCE